MAQDYRGLKHGLTVGFFFESGITDRISDRWVIARLPEVRENTQNINSVRSRMAVQQK
ncbi:hypothetical protein Osc7112_0521 [Oscillatoria nigro-viridis PCC 7112]|uniref:Uncharacterized protein n=1 Tax=Phormidium nigroviride PCC 7112 TaxID=179408 RepID=K9VC97_9CYAN|nr:hypothetical protein [Oscillatoria nigro-viridis]AFZ05119.1 hypothetical protein Osc7112_0521 [Oscillatoria nigro-viridis PCC 7112]